ncbi:hypothetical protein SAMN05518848_10910 [Paenibacillus sp. PDC88]|nr:hypothetical protein SAMN05518848_10910 [Paenibacillus sp. PDC88]
MRLRKGTVAVIQLALSWRMAFRWMIPRSSSIIPHPTIKNTMVVDTEKLPGHSHFYNDLWFGAHWMMWFGKSYYKYIPRSAILSFKNAFRLLELSNETIFVQLTPSIWEYDNSEYRKLQWDFREQTGIEVVAHELLHDDDENRIVDADPSVEILTEAYCIHGGIRLLRYYYNEGRQVVPRSEATTVLNYEVDRDGRVVWEEVYRL